MMFFAIALISACLAVGATLIVQKIAWRYGILDQPRGGRKIHTQPTPLLGGVALYVSFALAVAFLFFLRPEGFHAITDNDVAGKHLLGILVGGGLLIIGGVLDDLFDLKPWQQIFLPLLAVLAVIVAGIGVEALRHPITRESISLADPKILVLWWNGLPRYFSVLADSITVLWLLGVMYTTKFLDGLDGLVTGLTAIGALIIGLLSIFFFVNMPTALIAFITVGTCLGFLVFNFNPAKIFLGESGSLFCGFLLGILAIISGAKFATALLILGIPVIDAAWVIFRRVFIEKKSPFVGDRKHIHFRLLDAGFSHRNAVLTLYVCSAVFGISALFLQTQQKLAGLLFLVALFIGLAVMIELLRRKKENRPDA